MFGKQEGWEFEERIGENELTAQAMDLQPACLPGRGIVGWRQTSRAQGFPSGLYHPS